MKCHTKVVHTYSDTTVLMVKVRTTEPAYPVEPDMTNQSRLVRRTHVATIEAENVDAAIVEAIHLAYPEAVPKPEEPVRKKMGRPKGSKNWSHLTKTELAKFAKQPELGPAKLTVLHN